MATTISRDSAVGRGVATFIQSLIAFLVGLYAVPGVPQFVHNQSPKVALYFSLLVGIISFLNNFFRSSVPTV